MSDFQMHRHGLLMEPEPGNPMEVEGVLNPAAARGPDDPLYLFPRLVPWPTTRVPQVLASSSITLRARPRTPVHLALPSVRQIPGQRKRQPACVNATRRQKSTNYWRRSTEHSTAFAKAASTRICSTSSPALRL